MTQSNPGKVRNVKSDISVAAADTADAREILDLQKLAYQSEAAIYNDYSLPPLTQSLEQMSEEFQRQVVFKAVLGERVVGSVRGSLREGTCHIGRLIVHPEFQNQGIGTSLMKRIEQHFCNAERYELFTGEKSERNLYLYGKLGYRIVRRERLSHKTTLIFLQKPATEVGDGS
jgi:ribosomal protein S18 acetylase RimI-like enzyme